VETKEKLDQRDNVSRIDHKFSGTSKGPTSIRDRVGPLPLCGTDHLSSTSL
jgi:hypothetical protein